MILVFHEPFFDVARQDYEIGSPRSEGLSETLWAILQAPCAVSLVSFGLGAINNFK